MLQVAGLALADRFYACQCLPSPTRLPPVTSAAPSWSSSWLLSSIRRELPPNLMLKYVNKTMQMSGTTRCGGCGCGCGSSYRLRILRQLALSMRIPSSSLMCGNRAVRAAKSSQASYNNKQPRGVELRTWRTGGGGEGAAGDRRLTGHTYLPTYHVCVAWENEQKVEWNKIGRLAGVHIYYVVLEGGQGGGGGGGGKKHSTRAECEQRVRTFWLTSYAM